MSDPAEAVSAGSGAELIDAVADWLISQALGEPELEGLMNDCCQRLRAAGIPLLRAHISFRTLHPLYHAMGLTWRRDTGLETEGFLHADAADSQASEPWRRSPHFHMIENRIPLLRRRLAGEEALLDFPVLTEFRDQGATDYLAFTVPFDEEGRSGIVGSWTTDRSSGFSDQDIRSLVRIQRRLAVACKVKIKDQIARNVLNAYLGPSAGMRVLNGSIQRGDGEKTYAVIWYCDLRQSTAMAEAMSVDDFLRVLNVYFECTAGAVLARGGEVLLLIGDAVLAIFPIGPGGAAEEKACESALLAARDAQERLAHANRQRADIGLPPLAFGLGLHLGTVIYGNIGVPTRLEFTVVGPAVNEVARLESLTKALDRPVLASAEFAGKLSTACEPLGQYELRGLAEPRQVFAPPLAYPA